MGLKRGKKATGVTSRGGKKEERGSTRRKRKNTRHYEKKKELGLIPRENEGNVTGKG